MKSWVEISGARLAENFRAVRSVAGAGVEVLAVIKADAYGHGAAICAPVLVEAGAKWLGVSDLEEGIAQRELMPHSGVRLLVMCGMEAGDAVGMVAHGLTPVVWTVEHVMAMERAARAGGHRVPVHVEVETGMARQGAAVGEELAVVLRRRFPQTDAELEADLAACEEAAGNDKIEPREALKLIRKLHGHEEQLRNAGRPGFKRAIRPADGKQEDGEDIHSDKQERAS